ncbi:hypothetical protein WDV93_11720 [Pantoea ananatis]
MALAFLLTSVLSEANTVPTVSAPPLSNNDFSVLLNDYAFTPGDAWNNQSFIRAGKALSSVVAGEVVINEQRYNYYQHTYEGFQLFSATAVRKRQPCNSGRDPIGR